MSCRRGTEEASGLQCRAHHANFPAPQCQGVEVGIRKWTSLVGFPRAIGASAETRFNVHQVWMAWRHADRSKLGASTPAPFKMHVVVLSTSGSAGSGIGGSSYHLLHECLRDLNRRWYSEFVIRIQTINGLPIKNLLLKCDCRDMVKLSLKSPRNYCRMQRS